VPTLVAGTTYTAVLTQPSGTNTTGGSFSTGATSAGGCAPTITSFTPTCGWAGTVVTITGTNPLDASNLDSANSGGDVYFRRAATAGETLAKQPIPDVGPLGRMPPANRPPNDVKFLGRATRWFQLPR
jgi:hypothetical protein